MDYQIKLVGAVLELEHEKGPRSGVMQSFILSANVEGGRGRIAIIGGNIENTGPIATPSRRLIAVVSVHAYFP